MYTVTRHLTRFHPDRRFYTDEATKLKKTVYLPVTKFKNRLNVDQTIQRDRHIFEVISQIHSHTTCLT